MTHTWLKPYENKKIVILGYGMEGKSTYRLLKSHVKGVILQIMDRNAAYVEACFKDVEDKPFIYGEEVYLQAEMDVDLIFKSPGIPLKDLEGHMDLSKVTSQSNAFIEAYRDQVIGITGTKGKSTTASFLYELLKAHEVPAMLIGNIGKPPFDVIDNIEKDTALVYELSSHQLETVRYSPKIGVVLNLFEEHLDHYHSYDHYAEAKMNIGRYQKAGDVFVYGSYTDEIAERSKGFAGDCYPIGPSVKDNGVRDEGDGVTICYGNQLTLDDGIERKLAGHHNLVNMATAMLLARLHGPEDAAVELELLADFKGLPHRLAFVAEVAGVRFYNDSISTIPQATIAAVEAIPNVGMVLIGGMDRGIDYSLLEDYMDAHQEIQWILMYDTGKRIRGNLRYTDHVQTADSLEKAVKMAFRMTDRGKACLLSPAAPSYGFFKNFEERGQVFEALVRKL